jgi:hypothetical protein
MAKKKHKPGQGRKLFDGKNKDAVLLKLMQAWSVGATDSEAASHAEISNGALCQFLKRHPAISIQKEQLKEKPILTARVSLANAIQNGDGPLALKYLERKRKAEFSTLQEFAGPDGKPLAASVIQVYLPKKDPQPKAP